MSVSAVSTSDHLQISLDAILSSDVIQTRTQNSWYPLCMSNYLTRLRSTCSLWAPVRVGIVERTREEAVQPPKPLVTGDTQETPSPPITASTGNHPASGTALHSATWRPPVPPRTQNGIVAPEIKKPSANTNSHIDLDKAGCDAFDFPSTRRPSMKEIFGPPPSEAFPSRFTTSYPVAAELSAPLIQDPLPPPFPHTIPLLMMPSPTPIACVTSLFPRPRSCLSSPHLRRQFHILRVPQSAVHTISHTRDVPAAGTPVLCMAYIRGKTSMSSPFSSPTIACSGDQSHATLRSGRLPDGPYRRFRRRGV